ncbi:TonB-dependent receptor domain-containing protein [Brevundimonas sp.]|jgi:outer membrane receptor protein involved in Fe transport|uniref:TonB-dependent receptor domain-containing protein n=1 Tax=Brevundimonas sp. TaxID=1871086 RepID=UPI0037C00766
MSKIKLIPLIGPLVGPLVVPLIGGALALPAGAAAAQSQPAQTPPAQPAPTQTAPTQLAPGQTASAQTPPADKAAPSEVQDVVVTGQADAVRTSIDSISYSLANDLQATTGSLADALRNVPSVDVDPQGNVSLRGDSSVTILVDGRPSGILTGEGRAQALLQLPADRYARIEVMTNPSAVYSPEGSGGVINLITKPTAPKPGTTTTGSVRANVGDGGRWNLGVSGSRQDGKLTLSGDLSYRVDPIELEFPRLREQYDPVTGTLTQTTRVEQSMEQDQTGAVGRLTAEYKLTDKTQLSLEVRGNAVDGDGDLNSLFETRDAAGALVSAYRRDSTTRFDFSNWGVTGRVVQKLDDAGHEWSNELRFDRNENEISSLTRNDFITPEAADLYERNRIDGGQDILGFTSAYVRPTTDGGKIRLGYELTDQRPDQDSAFLRGPSEAGLAVVPELSNRFEGSQTVHALYGAWEKPLTAKLSAQAGLRLEQAYIEIDDRTSGLSADQDYFKAYPTGHLQYQLSETQTLRASYSRRIQRPQLQQLNPFVSYQDPLSRRSGNPDLKPQETDSVEAMWQMRKGQSFYQATAFLRDTDGAFTDVTTDLGGGILLTRPENLGGRRDYGVEANLNGRLHPTLRYSAGATLSRQEIDAAGIVGGSDREGEVASGRLSLNWQPTAKDFVQVMGFWQGDQLLAQGTREAGGMVNLGYRRKLTETLSFQFTGRDIFNSFNNRTVFDTPLFREETEQKIKLRAFYVGLTWSLGSGPRRQPEQFDFSAPSTGG